MGFLKEFKDFAMRGNMIDLAVGVVIGGAFSKIITSFVNNIIMPPLNLLTARSGMNFNNLSLKIKDVESPKMMPDGITVMKKADGSPETALQDYAILNYGPFIQAVIDFTLMAFAVFLAVKLINIARSRLEKEVKKDPPPAPEDILLLREIRDSLARQTPRRAE